MNKKNGIAAVCISVGLLAGCAGASESRIVRQKDDPKIVSAKEEIVNVPEKDTAVGLRTELKAPETYQSEVSDKTGRMKISIDAKVEIPAVSEIPSISVNEHLFEQGDIDAVTRALFGDANVYDARNSTEKLAAPYVFREELIDPWAPEQGTIRQINSFVEAADGSCYRYDLTKTDAFPMKVWAKRISGVDELEEASSFIWSEQDSMKLLYSWVPDESAISAETGMTMAEAQKLADAVANRFSLSGMQVSASEAVIELRLGYSGAPREKDMTNVGYAFHYTRNLAGVPITYTVIPGGARAGTDNSAVRWGYEALDIYVTKDGIDEISFANQYDIKETGAHVKELAAFTDIMAVFEKMMLLQNEGILIDRGNDEGDYSASPQTVKYSIDKITLGYMRIYDAYSGSRTGKLVPVWDFFGTCEFSYDGLETKQFRDINKSFLTINAMDATVIDRWIGY